MVERAEIAGAEAAAAVDFYVAVIAEIAVRMIADTAELDIADFAGGQALAVGIDDGEVVIAERPADLAEAALFARNGGNPAHLAGAAALRDRNAEFLLEPFPVFEQQRRRARGDEAQFWQGVAMRALLAVEQNVDGGRIAGGDGDTVLAQVLKETACRKFFRQDERRAAIDDRERAKSLRRVPAERAEIVQPVVRRDAKPFGQRIDVQQIFAEVEDDAFRLGAGARGEQDDGVVARLRDERRFLGLTASKLAEQRAALGNAPAAERQARRRRGRQQIVEAQPGLIDDQPRLEALENIAKLVAVHLDVHGADRGAGRHHAEIADEVLDRVVGQERHPVVAADAAGAQERGQAADRVAQLAVAHRAAIIGGDHPWLVGGARRGACDPAAQQV